MMVQLIDWLTGTQRRQRVSLVCALAPFYLGFVLGWMGRKPLPFFVGALGMAILIVGYRHIARDHSR